MNNYLLFTLKSALFDFSRNKGRTFLTSLGILIGVLAVVLLMAFGLGLKKYIENQFESIGANLIVVMPGNKNSMMRGGMVGGIKFDQKDVNKIKKVKNVSYVAPSFVKPASSIKANGKNEVGDLIASTEEMVPVFNLEIEKGKQIERTDVEKGSKIVLISSTLAKKLFNNAEDALGKTVSINNQNFKVRGILKSKGGGGIGGTDMDSNYYIPYKAAYSFNPDKKFFAIYLKAKDKENVSQAKLEIEKVLLKRYDKDDFSVLEQKEIMDTISSIFGIINLILVAIAAISLVVGGIGIMNIMYVTVTERIKEIGIRRAIGARKIDILSQFLVESIILSLLGGVIGLILAFIIVFIIQRFFPAYINLESILLALGVSSGIGIIFGVFPAKKAADLSPIDAIRYE